MCGLRSIRFNVRSVEKVKRGIKELCNFKYIGSKYDYDFFL